MKEIGLKAKLKGEKLSSPKTLTTVAILTALYIILFIFKLRISTTTEISFVYVASGVCGMFFGPLIGGLSAAVGDVISFFIAPNGEYFPGFTLSAFVSGFIYGWVLYGKPVSLKRVMVAVLMDMVICNLVLTPTWLNLMYGTSLLAVPRIIRTVVLYPVKITVLYQILKHIRVHVKVNG